MLRGGGGSLSLDAIEEHLAAELRNLMARQQALNIIDQPEVEPVVEAVGYIADLAEFPEFHHP